MYGIFCKCGQVFFLDFRQGPRKRLWLSGTENLGTKLQMCTHKVVENLNGWSCKVRLPTSTLTGTYLATLVRWIFSTLPLLCVTVNEAKK